MRAWILRVGVMFLVGTLLCCGHNPNHDIKMEEARAAADRVHAPPKPGEKREPGHGG